MNRRAAGSSGFGVLLVLAVLLLVATPTNARPSTPVTPYAGEFRPVVLPSPSAATMTAPAAAADVIPSIAPLLDTAGGPDTGDGLPIATSRPAVPQPTVAAVVEPKPTPKPTPRPKPKATTAPVVRVATSHSVSGNASWFCRAGVSVCTSGYPDGPGADMYAAAGPRLRRAMCGSDTSNCWRGRVVTVNGVAIKLVDWCQCYKGQSNEKLLDLYYDAWTRIPNVTRGVVVRW